MKKTILSQALIDNALGLSPTMRAYLGMTMMADDFVSDEEDLFDDEALALLDKTLDEIEDLPGFDIPYNGRYLLKLSRAIKTIKGKDGKKDRLAVEIGMEVMDTIKMDNDSDPATVPGTKFSQLSFLQGEEEGVKISIGMLKQFCAPIGEHFGEANLKNIVKNCLQDTLISATIVRRQRKDNPELYQARITNVQVEG